MGSGLVSPRHPSSTRSSFFSLLVRSALNRRIRTDVSFDHVTSIFPIFDHKRRVAHMLFSFYIKLITTIHASGAQPIYQSISIDDSNHIHLFSLSNSVCLDLGDSKLGAAGTLSLFTRRSSYRQRGCFHDPSSQDHSVWSREPVGGGEHTAASTASSKMLRCQQTHHQHIKLDMRPQYRRCHLGREWRT